MPISLSYVQLFLKYLAPAPCGEESCLSEEKWYYLWGACCKTCNQISLENLYSLSTINNFRYKVDHIYYGFRIIKLLEMFSFPNRESENDKNILSSPITEWSNATRDAVYLLDARNYILLDFNHILSDQFSSCMCTLLSTLVCVHVNTDFLRM